MRPLRNNLGAAIRGVGCAIAVAVAVVGFAGQAAAQGNMPQIPHLEQWRGSPHGKADAEAFNHWNKDGEIPEACARCHSTPGFRDYIGADGSTPWKVDRKAPVGTTIECVACHNDVTRYLTFVTFPSGLKIEHLKGGSVRCMLCHQGRESTVSVNAAVQGKPEDTVDGKLKFINVHYRAAAATRYGTQAKGGYEYAGKTYKGFYLHDKEFQNCTDCHNPHTTKTRTDECSFCHRNVRSVDDYVNIRESKVDFDGDGNTREGIAKEIGAIHDMLLVAIQKYAKEVSGTAIVYDAHHYPYFFVDKNENGLADPDEAKFPNQYKSWTPRLLEAAYNYQFVAKDPGAFTHNPHYVIQLMYDSLDDLSKKVPVNIANLKRPQ